MVYEIICPKCHEMEFNIVRVSSNNFQFTCTNCLNTLDMMQDL